MGLSIYIFIPSTFSGWKYCLKNPSSFFKPRRDVHTENEIIDRLKIATEYAWRCADKANSTVVPLIDENSRLRHKIHELERKLKTPGD